MIRHFDPVISRLTSLGDGYRISRLAVRSIEIVGCFLPPVLSLTVIEQTLKISAVLNSGLQGRSGDQARRPLSLTHQMKELTTFSPRTVCLPGAHEFPE